MCRQQILIESQYLDLDITLMIEDNQWTSWKVYAVYIVYINEKRSKPLCHSIVLVGL